MARPPSPGPAKFPDKPRAQPPTRPSAKPPEKPAERPADLAAQLAAAAESCRRTGERLTDLRRDVLGLILQTPGPVTAYQLLDRLKESRAGAAPPTIYRALEFLLRNHLIHKVESLNAFIPCTGTGHHSGPAQFLICRVCGAVSELEDRAVAEALRRAAERQGFHANDVIVEISGTCAACLPPDGI